VNFFAFVEVVGKMEKSEGFRLLHLHHNWSNVLAAAEAITAVKRRL